MDQIKQTLLARLERKGIEPKIIPVFISTLANTIRVNPKMNLLNLNRKLHLLGWDGFELDYHTFQLAAAFIEAKGVNGLIFNTNTIV